VRVKRELARTRVASGARPADLVFMREQFETSSGLVELTFDEETRIVSAHRFGANGRPVAAAMENWDHADFASVLMRQLGLPPGEAAQIAAVVRAAGAGRSRRPAHPYARPPLALRLAALPLRVVIAVLPLAIFLGVFLLVVRR